MDVKGNHCPSPWGMNTQTMHINNLRSPNMFILQLSFVKTVAVSSTSEGIKLRLQRFSHSGRVYPCRGDCHLSCSVLAQLWLVLLLQIFPLLTHSAQCTVTLSEFWLLWVYSLGCFYRSGGERASPTHINGSPWGAWCSYMNQALWVPLLLGLENSLRLVSIIFIEKSMESGLFWLSELPVPCGERFQPFFLPRIHSFPDTGNQDRDL